ncbi:MAG: cytidine deaminase [Candidatus Puniceispirillaceae bacterium]
MATDADLLSAALSIRSKAYAPYSNFLVGAAILDEQGQIHLGVNVENAAYPVGACAEASAISAMVATGGRQIKAIAVVGAGPVLCTPCGGCRQRIREFANPDTPVLVGDESGLKERFTLDQLLPASFGPDNLESK